MLGRSPNTRGKTSAIYRAKCSCTCIGDEVGRLVKLLRLIFSTLFIRVVRCSRHILTDRRHRPTPHKTRNVAKTIKASSNADNVLGAVAKVSEKSSATYTATDTTVNTPDSSTAVSAVEVEES